MTHAIGDFRNLKDGSFEYWNGESWVLVESLERRAYKQAIFDSMEAVKALPQEVRSNRHTSIDLVETLTAIEALGGER